MIRVSIVGASGYTGGDLLRILLFHPQVEIHQVTSERHAGKMVSSVHPNLRKICKHKFVSVTELEPCDVLFLGLPHGQMMNRLPEFESLADTLIDLSADFRLHDNDAYAESCGHGKAASVLPSLETWKAPIAAALRMGYRVVCPNFYSSPAAAAAWRNTKTTKVAQEILLKVFSMHGSRVLLMGDGAS